MWFGSEEEEVFDMNRISRAGYKLQGGRQVCADASSAKCRACKCKNSDSLHLIIMSAFSTVRGRRTSLQSPALRAPHSLHAPPHVITWLPMASLLAVAVAHNM